MDEPPDVDRSTRVTPMSAADWPAVRAIYVEGIATGDATFESEAPGWEEWDTAHLHDHRLVARRGESIVGWAALSAMSDRCVYAGVAESSVYVAERARGQGVGNALMSALVRGTDSAGIWTLQTCIFPENEASLRLHQVCGFRVVGTRERIGEHHGRWRDVAFLERRRA